MKSSRVAVGVVAASFLAVTILFPVYWGVRTSLAANYDLGFLPSVWTLDHYRYLFETGQFLVSIRNSVTVSLAAVAVTIPLSVLAGYALARLSFRGKRYSAAVLILPLLPAVAVLVPLILYMRALGLYNTLWAIVLGVVVFNLPFAIWMMRSFLLGMPRDIEDAAKVDGCGTMQLLRRIILPLLGPGLVAVGIFVFITAWNNYLFAFAFTTQQELRVVPVALLGFISAWGTNYGGMNAAATVAMVPPLVLFLAFQRWFIQGLLAGSGR